MKKWHVSNSKDIQKYWERKERKSSNLQKDEKLKQRVENLKDTTVLTLSKM